MVSTMRPVSRACCSSIRSDRSCRSSHTATGRPTRPSVSAPASSGPMTRWSRLLFSVRSDTCRPEIEGCQPHAEPVLKHCKSLVCHADKHHMPTAEVVNRSLSWAAKAQARAHGRRYPPLSASRTILVAPEMSPSFSPAFTRSCCVLPAPGARGRCRRWLPPRPPAERERRIRPPAPRRPA